MVLLALLRNKQLSRLNLALLLLMPGGLLHLFLQQSTAYLEPLLHDLEMQHHQII